MPDLSLFDEVADALRGLSPADLGQLHCRHHRYGIKVWLGPATKAPREHYEAQVIGGQHVSEATTLAIEVGFHSEHRREADNEAVISALAGSERSGANCSAGRYCPEHSSDVPSTGGAYQKFGPTQI
jgi:hypothetical protein